eukprot:CAMPEP_0201722058 /NCGR_PEP_ID=MMETSP0593-20130828/6539_1 /ASSEMBLY_ACC=CAM_ASM_000672 /TAXON_ID=267983 /ORGANISM="Skeletonema japonicum, Strain CCMP2506" /LENGTH=53 /DNA_ID=CAMNT_0048212959 /DNA_START=37 /DNA_END=195 /DNA_ORIENTATION=+
MAASSETAAHFPPTNKNGSANITSNNIISTTAPSNINTTNNVAVASSAMATAR